MHNAKPKQLNLLTFVRRLCITMVLTQPKLETTNIYIYIYLRPYKSSKIIFLN